MRKRSALTGLVLALAAAGGAVAANPHAQSGLALSQDGCTVTATATWSSVRMARVDFYFISFGEPAGQFATPSVSVEPRPARAGTLSAQVGISAGQESGRVTAVFVDAKGDQFAGMSETYTLAPCP